MAFHIKRCICCGGTFKARPGVVCGWCARKDEQPVDDKVSQR